MIKYFCIAFFSIIIITSIAGAQDLSIPELYNLLSKAELSEQKAEVDHVRLFRGGQEIYLEKGSLRFLKPIDGTLYAAIFLGKGAFTFAPPSPIERKEFERQTSFKLDEGKHVFNFVHAMLWFSDTLLQSELGPGIEYHSVPISRTEREMMERSVKYATDPANQNILYRLIAERFEISAERFLFAHFFLDTKREIFLTYDPRRYEEVALHRTPFETFTGAIFWLELLNSFHRLEEYDGKSEYELAREHKNRIDQLKSTIDLSIESRGQVSGHATLHVRSLDPSLGALLFRLDPSLSLDSITTAEGTRLDYHRADESWRGLVRLPLSQHDTCKLVFYYRGDFIRPAGFIPRSTTGWYPKTDEIDRQIFDVTFRIPKGLTLIAAGTKQSEAFEGDYHVTRYVSNDPTITTAFQLTAKEGETYRLSDDELPVTVYDMGREGEPEEIAKNLANSIRLYTHLFGTNGYKELRATMWPGPHGEAHQEFLYLPGIDQIIGRSGSSVAIGRAHEVAHSWWGHGVGIESYHDLWLAEAFAHYSALLYAPFVLRNEKDFYSTLARWRESIAERRKFALGSGATLGSIWLGYRASSSKTYGDYSLSTYQKGAWVLHMLRMMMLHFTTMDEEKFKSMMKEFYNTYRGKETTTDDFRQIVEKYIGGNMRWFFDQWVYGSEIPTLACAFTKSLTPTGKHKLVINIAQSDVSSPFLLYLPFELRYKNGALARARLVVNDWKKEFVYELEQEPEDVQFNIMESVLCSIED